MFIHFLVCLYFGVSKSLVFVCPRFRFVHVRAVHVLARVLHTHAHDGQHPVCRYIYVCCNYAYYASMPTCVYIGTADCLLTFNFGRYLNLGQEGVG